MLFKMSKLNSLKLEYLNQQKKKLKKLKKKLKQEIPLKLLMPLKKLSEKQVKMLINKLDLKKEKKLNYLKKILS